MTLYRQLLATMLLLFGLLFAATYWVQFDSTHSYLAQQQETTVINTSTALGLALTPYLENGDKVGAESVIKAVSDGSYYKLVRLDLLASKNVIELENSSQIEGVPQWFIGLDLFPEVSNESILTSGWFATGQVEGGGPPGTSLLQALAGHERAGDLVPGRIPDHHAPVDAGAQLPAQATQAHLRAGGRDRAAPFRARHSRTQDPW